MLSERSPHLHLLKIFASPTKCHSTRRPVPFPSTDHSPPNILRIQSDTILKLTASLLELLPELNPSAIPNQNSIRTLPSEFLSVALRIITLPQSRRISFVFSSADYPPSSGGVPSHEEGLCSSPAGFQPLRQGGESLPVVGRPSPPSTGDIRGFLLCGYVITPCPVANLFGTHPPTTLKASPHPCGSTPCPTFSQLPARLSAHPRSCCARLRAPPAPPLTPLAQPRTPFATLLS